MASNPLAILSSVVVATALAGCGPDSAPTMTKAELGEQLFSDKNLSKHRTQSCATCHDPERAFIDSREGLDGRVSAVSLGDDGVSLGDRNTPTAAYAAFAPRFSLESSRSRHNKQKQNKLYEGPVGGQFLDGRESDLEGQAGGPPLNPIEMGMADKASVVARLQENPAYVEALRGLYGGAIFDDPEAAYAAMAESIAAFEKTSRFAPFDSKYDRSLRGEATLSFMELTGKSLFFSQFTNCAICHQLHGNGDPIKKFEETFSGYEYHNLGVPVNEAVRAKNGVTEVDRGLNSRPEINDPSHDGKFKTPTLRNVAVTGPYMHNGVFRDLRTVILFYESYTNPSGRAENPETKKPWARPEVDATVSRDLLEVGDALTDTEVDALVCFLRTLTDQRYEPLIEDKGIVCGD